MNKILLFFLLLSLIITPLNPVFADDNSDSTQTNTSGSNTSISGGYTSETTNTFDGGQTNTTTTTSTNTSSTNQKSIPVGNASAPSMSSYSQDLCTVGLGFGIQTLGLGISGGTYFTDPNCE